MKRNCSRCGKKMTDKEYIEYLEKEIERLKTTTITYPIYILDKSPITPIPYNPSPFIWNDNTTHYM